MAIQSRFHFLCLRFTFKYELPEASFEPFNTLQFRKDDFFSLLF